jgi:hypothetical protein
MTNEDMFVIVGCLLGAFIVYNIFLMFWKGSTIEGLQNQKVAANTGLLANSGASLAAANKELEVTTNDLLLTNSTYNTNYSTKCTTMYDIINLQMVKIVAGLEPDGDKTVYIKDLTNLNTMYQAKIALNDTLKTIDAVETTDEATTTATSSSYSNQAMSSVTNAKNGVMSSVSSMTSKF